MVLSNEHQSIFYDEIVIQDLEVKYNLYSRK